MYSVWKSMKARCHQPRDAAYKRYGARGIVVCNEWRDDFSVFLADMGMRPTPDHSIDRIDNNGNYEPGNCRWSTKREQCRNTRRTVKDAAGRSIAERAETADMPYETVRYRLAHGIDLSPVDKRLRL